MSETPCAAPECSNPGTKLCGRCGGEAYCSAECQRKAWPAHKQFCQKADSPENAIRELLQLGRLYTARERLRELPKPSAKLEAELEELIGLGVHSEAIGDTLRLDSVGEMGQGYVATRDLAPGEPLLFDTAFVTAPLDGSQEFFFLMEEKLTKRLAGDLRRKSAKVDAQADFFYRRFKALPLKGNMDRTELEGSEQGEQIIVCSIAEGCSLYCSEELGHMALYPAAAHFNHSCAPNATLASSRSTALVRAAAAIPAGQEVFISYLPPALLEEPLEKRRARLEGGRGFVCGCARCRAEEAQGASDTRGGH